MTAPARSRLWLAGLLLLVALFFGQVLVGGQVYYPGDTARVYLPQRTALAESLDEGRLPWWNADLGLGYPLLAEGEVGALYPPNWLIFGALSRLGLRPLVGISVLVVVHSLLAAAGFWALCRVLGLSPLACALGALAFAQGGFLAAHLSHLALLSVAAWMPWLLLFTHQIIDASSRRGRLWSGVGLAAVVALQFLAGHPQASLLLLLPAVAYGGWRLIQAPRGHWLSVAWPWALSLMMGIVLALPQLLPTYRLSALSQRAGGLEASFFASYSFHPLLAATCLSPFLLGNPYPEGSVEVMAYTGLLTLALAAVALIRGRGRLRWFLVGLGGVGFVLALGDYNPLYAWLRYVPLLNLFRAPARYLAWTSLALSLLAALGADALLRAAPKRVAPRARGLLLAPLAASVTALAVVVLTRSDVTVATEAGRDVRALVAAWRWLPLVLAVGCVGLLLADQRTTATAWGLAACALLAADLYAYGAVLDGTYNSTWPLAEATKVPPSVAYLRQDDGLYRTYTKEEIVPALSVQRASLYPNMAATWGLSSANLYMPLVPRRYGSYVADLDAERLNRMNVRYYLIPQLLPVDEATELYDVQNPFSALPTDRWLAIEPQRVSRVVVESYLSHAADLPDGALAAELLLRDGDGQVHALPLRAGIESAEWAYERDDVAEVVAHAMPEVATTWPARSGFPSREHVGHTYRAAWAWDAPLTIEAVMLRPVLPAAYVRVERVRLASPEGDERLLAHLLGLGDHEIVYRSEDVLIYRNHDALPRAYLLDASQVRFDDEGGLTFAASLRPQDVTPVAVLRYEHLSVELLADSVTGGYVVLSDLAYPGWHVTIDGAPAESLVADGVFRAVAVTPGQHTVEWTYRPWQAALAGG